MGFVFGESHTHSLFLTCLRAVTYAFTHGRLLLLPVTIADTREYRFSFFVSLLSDLVLDSCVCLTLPCTLREFLFCFCFTLGWPWPRVLKLVGGRQDLGGGHESWSLEAVGCAAGVSSVALI